MKNQDTDVTTLVKFGSVDDEFLPLLNCVCGHSFLAWDFILGTEREEAMACPACSRRLYFRGTVRVFEVCE